MYAGGMFSLGRRIAAQLERVLGTVDHSAARALVRPRTLRGSGTDGGWTQRDHRRAFMGGCMALILGWTIAMAIFMIADRRPAGTTWNTVISGVGLFFVFGASYIGWQGFKHLRGAFRRAPAARTS